MRKMLLRILTVWICCLIFLGVAQQSVYSEVPTIHVFLEGKLLEFDDAKPELKNGRTLVPFRKLFEALGFEIEWVSSGGVQKAIGTKNDLTIALTINNTNAKVNGKDVALDVPAQIVKGRTLVPLRFVSENSGYHVSHSKVGGVLTIQVGTIVAGMEPGSAATEKAEPYVVKGRVIDAQGNPLKGAKVFADNQLLYNSNLVLYTDANGYYRIELPSTHNTWNAGSNYTAHFNKIAHEFHMTPDVDEPFAGNTGAIRNFTWVDLTRELYVYIDLDDSFGDHPYEITDIELVLTPIGPIIDGSPGQVIVLRGSNMDRGGYGLENVPVAKYKATANYTSAGQEPAQLLIRVRNEGEYTSSVDFQFSNERYSINRFAELEVKRP